MKKILLNIKDNTKVHYVIIFIIMIITSIPIINLQLIDTDDGMLHLLRIMGMTKIFKTGIFPQFINQDYCSNWGYAINLFYGPITTYIPYLFKLFTTHYYDALKIYTVITIFLCGLTMYKFVVEVTKKKEIAIVATIIYMLFPYKLETIYNRFAIGEFSAYIFLPILFMGLYNLINSDGKKYYYIAIGTIGLILTHAITTEYAAFFCIIYILFNIRELKRKDVMKKIFINLVIILGMTSFFIIPLLEYKICGNYAIFDSKLMRTSGGYVQKYLFTLKELLIDSPDSGVSFKIGMPIIILVLLGLFTYKKTDVKYKKIYILYEFFAIISLIMCLKIFHWEILPDFLCIIQYPWRMLTFFGFFISIVCAINAVTLGEIISKSNEIMKSVVIIIEIILIILLDIPLITRYKPTELEITDKRYEGYIIKNPKITHMQINRDYLPVNSIVLQNTYMKTRKDCVYVLKGSATIENENKTEDLKMSFNILNASKDTVLELPYLYYFGYITTLEENGETIKINTFESENGFVAIKLPEDIKNAEVKIEYKGTTIEKISYIISAITLIICIIYIIRKRGEKIENKRKCKK